MITFHPERATGEEYRFGLLWLDLMGFEFLKPSVIFVILYCLILRVGNLYHVFYKTKFERLLRATFWGQACVSVLFLF